MTDPERVQRILWDLHARGFRIAIDDFGTGYSSLSRLKHLPVDILKIDRSFVHDLPEDHHAASIVTAITRLAHGLGMVPLGEGIENREQLAFLSAHGCSLGQGYHFSRPISAPAVIERYRAERSGSGPTPSTASASAS
jgi:EAL domain-containing protein (putative c-di-GMP-specific phosphodiesterase class I)